MRCADDTLAAHFAAAPDGFVAISLATVSDILAVLDGEADQPDVLSLHADLRDLLLGEG